LPTTQDGQSKTHLVDEGYIQIDLLVKSKYNEIDLVGAIPSSNNLQDWVEGIFDHTQFHIDWENQYA
jgi:hypothetical protein